MLIVEDSQVVRDFLTHIMESDPAIQIVGFAADGLTALEAVSSKRPDIITMDINMPKMNGLEATRQIMENYPTPIVIVSGSQDSAEVKTVFSAVDAGAVAIVSRPVGIGHPDFREQADQLVKLVKTMSEVKVIKRRHRARSERISSDTQSESTVETSEKSPRVEIVAVGASTGGPIALKVFLSSLPTDFLIPVAIVQHMARGFTEGFSEWLEQATGRPVRIARTNSLAEPGITYIAPEDRHLEVRTKGRLILTDNEPVNGLRPSVAALFASVAEQYGPKSAGVLLTGMGRDGAAELKLMRDRGAVTFAQDQASSVVYGMPGEALRLGSARYVMAPAQIAMTLARLTRRK